MDQDIADLLSGKKAPGDFDMECNECGLQMSMFSKELEDRSEGVKCLQDRSNISFCNDAQFRKCCNCWFKDRVIQAAVACINCKKRAGWRDPAATGVEQAAAVLPLGFKGVSNELSEGEGEEESEDQLSEDEDVRVSLCSTLCARHVNCAKRQLTVL